MEHTQIFGLGTFMVKILWELGGEVNWFYVLCVCVCVCVCVHVYMRARACMDLHSYVHTYDCLAKAEAVHCLV